MTLDTRRAAFNSLLKLNDISELIGLNLSYTIILDLYSDLTYQFDIFLYKLLLR